MREPVASRVDMICATCCALELASEDSLRALVVWQARQIDRLTGGRYEEPNLGALQDLACDGGFEHAPDAQSVMESLLWADDVLRKPPRVAAPRILERLGQHGFQVVPVDKP